MLLGYLLVESIYCQSQITLDNGTGNAIRTISKTVRNHTALLVFSSSILFILTIAYLQLNTKEPQKQSNDMHKVIHENICIHVLRIVEEISINDKRLHVEHETYKPSNEGLNNFILYLLTFEVFIIFVNFWSLHYIC